MSSKKGMRYLVFSYGSYYPNGGMSDCVLKTNDVNEAVCKAVDERDENFMYTSVYDTYTGEYVTLPEEE